MHFPRAVVRYLRAAALRKLAVQLNGLVEYTEYPMLLPGITTGAVKSPT